MCLNIRCDRNFRSPVETKQALKQPLLRWTRIAKKALRLVILSKRFVDRADKIRLARTGEPNWLARRSEPGQPGEARQAFANNQADILAR